MPLYPFSSYISLAFLAFVVVLMAFNAETRVAVIIGPVWFGILLAAYYGKGFHKRKDIGLENGQTFAEKA